MKQLGQKFLFIILLGISLLSCNQQASNKKKAAACSANEAFSNKERDCIQTAFIPTPSLSFVTFIENSNDYVVTLSYTDRDGDFASACSIDSIANPADFGINLGTTDCTCLGGVCTADFQLNPDTPTGHDDVISEFSYSIMDEDGWSQSKVVQLRLIPENQAPQVINTFDTFSVLENSNISSATLFDLTDGTAPGTPLNAYFEDPDGVGDDLKVYMVTAPDSSIVRVCNVVGGGVTIDNCNPNIGTFNKVAFIPVLNVVYDRGVTQTTTMVVKACDKFGLCSSDYSLDIEVVPNQIPATQNYNISVNDHLPFTFLIPSPLNASSTSYELLLAPNVGAFTGCVAGLSLSNGLCNYDPQNTSANQTGDYATETIGGVLTIASDSKSSWGNNISINLIASNLLQGKGSEFNYIEIVEGLSDTVPTWTINVYYDSFTTIYSDLATLINSDFNSSALVTASTSSSSLVSTFSGSLSGGTDGYASIVYCKDNFTSAGGSCNTSLGQRGIISIDITKGNQAPKICEYSKFYQAPECGFNGCIDSRSPVNVITPSKAGVYFYDTSTSSCYVSSGTAASSWTLYNTGFIDDQSINENDKIIITTRVDEDEVGSMSQDLERVRISKLTSSDETIFPVSNMRFTYDGANVFITPTPSIPSTWFGSTTKSSDIEDFIITLTPITGVSGSSTIEIELEDDNNHTSTISFVATVMANSAIFKGWRNIESIGAKFNYLNVVKERSNICPYSVGKCNGLACKGTADPMGTVTPDNIGAIYYNSTSGDCFYANSASSSAWQSFNTYCGASEPGSPMTGTCDYSSSCAGTTSGECIGDSSPIGSISSTAGSYFYDRSTEGCYINTDGASAWDHVGCGSLYGASCVGTSPPAVIPMKKDNLYYDQTSKVCYRSTGTSNASQWEPFRAPSNVTIATDAFSFPAGIDRTLVTYNVYRRLANETIDYTLPINKVEVKEDLTTSTVNFLDDGINSYQPPSPSTVYFYEIVPFIDGKKALTNDVNQNPRVLAAPGNMSFVHRWVVNRVNCEKIGAVSDPNDDYSCSYNGPGDNNNRYKLSYDILVDRFEVGCQYSSSCDTATGQCLGVNSPHGSVSADKNDLFYDRSSGNCYVNKDGAITWAKIDSSNLPISNCNFTTIGCGTVDGRCIGDSSPEAVVSAALNATYLDRLNKRCYKNIDGATGWSDSDLGEVKQNNIAHLPPLVNIDQEDADSFCKNVRVGELMGISDGVEPLTKSLPNRKEQVAYSLWENGESPGSESSIATKEEGLLLNLANTNTPNGVCNSSQANGLSSRFNDSDIPSSSDFFTLPSTLSSGTQIIMTGSEETSACRSRFGVQDAVGNVAEWTTDRVRCNSLVSCEGIHSLNDDEVAPIIGRLDTKDSLRYDLGSEASYTEFNLLPYNGLPTLSGAHTAANAGICPFDGDPPGTATRYFGACNETIDQWFFSDTENYNLGNFFPTIGLPLHNEYLIEYPGSTITNASFTNTSLTRGDHFKPNREIIFSEEKACGGFATGGSYLDGAGAGVYALEFVPCSENSSIAGKAGYFRHSDFALRAVNSSVAEISIEIVNNAVDVPITVDNILKDIMINKNTLPTNTDIVNIINSTPDAANLVEAVEIISGSTSFEMPQEGMSEVILKNNRRDIGLRCIIPLQDSYYEE